MLDLWFLGGRILELRSWYTPLDPDPPPPIDHNPVIL